MLSSLIFNVNEIENFEYRHSHEDKFACAWGCNGVYLSVVGTRRELIEFAGSVINAIESEVDEKLFKIKEGLGAAHQEEV